jgi:hypothetical protein
MAKVLGIPENFRVVVEPRGLGHFGSVSMGDGFISRDPKVIAKLYRERCEEIAAEIKRHVDNVGYVSVESDAGYQCEHCGGVWTEVSADYNGGCCSKDEGAEIDRLAAQEDV